MKPKTVYTIHWCLWVTVGAIAMIMFALATAKSEPHHDMGGQYMPQSAEEYWGEKWPDILKFYYPHDHAHGTWFNNYGTNCCGGQDCFPARHDTVKWTPEGYRVLLPDGGHALVPEEKAPFNPEEVSENRALVCLVYYGASYMEDMEAHGIRYFKTGYRIRPNCLWSGRTRI